VIPFVYYRYSYTYGKRLRVVTEGRVYRSGCMTAPGFRDAVARLGIRTIINLMDEAPDPDIAKSYFGQSDILESQLCREMGVRFVAIAPDLVARTSVPAERPKAIEQFLAVMDNPSSYPVLIHCRAGLHRTGCAVAIYRMEYEDWTVD